MPNLTPSAYSFDNQYSSIRYVRLDGVGNSGEENLHTVKSFLAAGFACVFGFPVNDPIRHNPGHRLSSMNNAVIGGQAVMAVGYDDKRRYRSEKGALLIKNSWGASWGKN